MTHTHVVLRDFQGTGRTVQRGEVVDASAWPGAPHLVNQKYLKEKPYGLEPLPCGCGLAWASPADLERHDCSAKAKPTSTPGGQAPARQLATAGNGGQQKGGKP